MRLISTFAAFMLAAAMMAASPTITLAQQAAAPAPAAASYTTENTDLGTLLDDPAAKAVLTKHIPDVISNPGIDNARGMTLKQVQQYAADQLTDKVLAEIDVDLAKLPAKK